MSSRSKVSIVSSKLSHHCPVMSPVLSESVMSANCPPVFLFRSSFDLTRKVVLIVRLGVKSRMKIFSIGGIYSPRGSPETIEKSPKKNKKREPTKRGRERERGKAGTAEKIVVSFSLRSPRPLFLCGLFFIEAYGLLSAAAFGASAGFFSFSFSFLSFFFLPLSSEELTRL